MSIFKLPAGFIAYWRELSMRDCFRNTRVAHRYLQMNWRSGAHVPGYPDVPDGMKRLEDYPLGWSYANLLRHKPSPAARAIMRAVKK